MYAKDIVSKEKNEYTKKKKKDIFPLHKIRKTILAVGIYHHPWKSMCWATKSIYLALRPSIL